MAGCRGKHAEFISGWVRWLHRLVRLGLSLVWFGNLRRVKCSQQPLAVDANKRFGNAITWPAIWTYDPRGEDCRVAVETYMHLARSHFVARTAGSPPGERLITGRYLPLGGSKRVVGSEMAGIFIKRTVLKQIG